MLKHFRSGTKRVRTIWWILTIGTVVTFIGGFIFLFGADVGGFTGATATPQVLGKVNGEPITIGEWEAALDQTTQQYKSQMGTDPTGADIGKVREQAWINLVTEKVLDDAAKDMGIQVTDPEIVFAARNTPPPEVVQNPAFQTNKRFDLAKWQQALSDPRINWNPLEDRLRRVLPAQKLEERLVASVKFSEPELRRAFQERYEKAGGTYAFFKLGPAVDTTRLNDAALRAYYEKHRGQFAGGLRVQSEVAMVVRRVGPEQERIAKVEADEIVARARRGEDFAQLARELSEGQFADQGGKIPNDLPFVRLPPQLKPAVATMKVGDVTDPMRDGNSFYIFRIDSRRGVPGQDTLRISQIEKPIRPSPENEEADQKLVVDLRRDAARQGLAAAAARHNLVSTRSQWYSAPNEFVPVFMQLQVPQAQQWTLDAKLKEVSRAYATDQGWVIAQVVAREEPGPRAFENVRDEVRRALEIEMRQESSLAAARRFVAAVRGGQSFEAAAQANGGTVAKADSVTREYGDPRLSVYPKVIGALFGLRRGAMSEPITGSGGAIVMRQDYLIPANPALFEQVKGQLSQGLLSQKQQVYLRAWIDAQRKKAQIEDLRPQILAGT